MAAHGTSLGWALANYIPVTPSPTAETARFRTIHDKHFSMVTGALGRLGVREPDLPDVAQQVFLVAFLRLPAFEGRSAVSTWLWGICRRLASDYRRSAYIRREVPVGDHHLEELASSTEDPAVDLERHQRLDAMAAALDFLPETQRVALVLFELDQMPARHIAESLQLPLGTVRSRVRLARRRLERVAASYRQS
jgi:RNA polymerase sigma-70 factor (ECF subfamily)